MSPDPLAPPALDPHYYEDDFGQYAKHLPEYGRRDVLIITSHLL